MVYLKSIIAGVLALLFVAILSPTIVLVAVSVTGLGTGLGIDMVRWHLESPFFWLPAITIFSAGFLWEYRRLSK
jgi:hypothetical protein